MDPRMYLSALRRRWPLIIILGILGAAVAFFYDSTLPTLYKSTASVFVSTQRGDTTSELVQGSNFAQANVQSYARLATTPLVLQPVIDELDLDTSVNGLASVISADTPLNTVIIQITVQNSDPARAAMIADAVTSSLSTVVEKISPTSADKTPAVKMTQIASAQVPAAPFAPNTRLIVATGLAVGLALGLVLALIWELLDTRVRSEKELTAITGLPVLGAVAKGPSKKPGWIAMRSDSHSMQAESYRRIRANLEFADIERAVRSVIVTSATAGEGKSTTSLNLALAMAERVGRVLLIDGDLRRPTIADRCGLEGSVGLTTVLLGKISVADAVQRYARTVDVLASGVIPHNPGQLLGSSAMAALLAEVSKTYDFVVIDTPPLLAATDTLGLAHATDGAIVVVKYKSTRRQQLAEAVGSMRTVNARLLGVVFDRIPTPKAIEYYSYHAKHSNGSADLTASGLDEVDETAPSTIAPAAQPESPVPAEDVEPAREPAPSAEPQAVAPTVTRTKKTRRARSDVIHTSDAGATVVVES
ncbi:MULTISPECIES: polysaccharide biosynthesis tyrosine autokinase [unclassified Leifsonia]|uniref:polysaccharide biosynthesis tyrosine autokinase n=1 Tax=unclassified Leifsonia TaxID=2663824 RepID=UPI000AA8C947|nr:MULTISPECIES: polysaccharide biosynthesis tyrosine autokinase [unclassified Leifsonia]